jgi:GNAT superfamily N-acetyltransferase
VSIAPAREDIGVDAHIRPYDAARDADGLRQCVIEQQDFHRSLEPSWPAGGTIVDEYLEYLRNRCADQDGAVMVADREGELIGFVCVVASMRNDAPDDPAPFAWVHDIFVRSAFRRAGIATKLMAEAEAFAQAHGASTLRFGVLGRNSGARAFYEREGFREYVVVMTKSVGE